MKNYMYYLLAIAVIVIVIFNKNTFIEPMYNNTNNINTNNIQLPNTTNLLTRDDYDCYLINLEKNAERLSVFSSYYKESDLNKIPYIKIKAIYGRDIDYASFISPNAELNMTPGMVGCFLSHLHIYNEIKKSIKDYALIFEDDARMIRDIQISTINNIKNTIPNDWDIILLGYDVSHPLNHEIVQYDNYIKVYGFYGTHAYLITKRGAEKMLNLAKIPFTNQIDHVMGDLCRLGLLNVYGISSPVVWQEARFTDVQTNPE